MLEIIGVLIFVWICWSILKGLLKGAAMSANSERNAEFEKETRHIVINELGIPHDYYSKTIQNKEKWDYIRSYAETLKKHGNESAAILIKSDINEIDVDQCSWARLLAYGVADLYKGEKPYYELTKQMTENFK